jgi:hypothetical protein
MLDMTNALVEAVNQGDPNEFMQIGAQADGRQHAAPRRRAAGKRRPYDDRGSHAHQHAARRISHGQLRLRGRNGAGEIVRGTMEGATAGAVADLLSRHRCDAAGNQAVHGLRRQGRNRRRVATSTCSSKKSSTSTCCFSAGRCIPCCVPACPSCARWPACRNRATNPAMRDVLQDVRESLDSGRELSISLARHPGCSRLSICPWCASAK